VLITHAPDQTSWCLQDLDNLGEMGFLRLLKRGGSGVVSALAIRPCIQESLDECRISMLHGMHQPREARSWTLFRIGVGTVT
jgi:hypothetical protein